MKALVLENINEPLVFKEVETPQPKPNETLVQIKAAALNHRDVWISKGMYPNINPPCVLGSDGAGITEDGKEVIINPSFLWGDNPRVQSFSYKILGLPDNGALAEYVTVPSTHVYPKPAHLTFEQAAALPLAGLTAYRALFTRGALEKGEKVLISGVGGGVALFACQFAIAAGAEVYVTSSSEAKIAAAIKLGAKGGANYKSDTFVKDLGKLSPVGFDVIIDSAGGDGFRNLVKVAAMGGRIVFYGGTRGNITKLSPQIIFWKQLSLLGSTMGTEKEFEQMIDFVNKNKVVPVVDTVFDLKDGNQAFEYMDAGKQFGKIVVRI